MLNTRFTQTQLNSMVGSTGYKASKNGMIVTVPVRLAFPHIASARHNSKGGDYFDLCAIVSGNENAECFERLVNKLVAEHFPESVGNDHADIKSPLRKQLDYKIKGYQGFDTGICFNASSTFKVPVFVPGCDGKSEKLADNDVLSRVYGGVWCVLSLQPYAFGKKPGAQSRGIGFGLRSILLIADDTRFVSDRAPSGSEFDNIKIQTSFDPSMHVRREEPQSRPLPVFSVADLIKAEWKVADILKAGYSQAEIDAVVGV